MIFLINSYLATIWSITIIIRSTYCDNWSIVRNADRLTKSITFSFTINIFPNLCPGTMIILINSYVAWIIKFTVSIAISSNSNNRTIRRQWYWVSKIVPFYISKNIVSNLSPCTIIVLINTYTTEIRIVNIISIGSGSSNSNNVTIFRKTYWPAWPFIYIISINIFPNLCPCTIIVLINSYLTSSTKIGGIWNIFICSNSYSETVAWNTYWSARKIIWIISKIIFVYLVSNLRRFK